MRAVPNDRVPLDHAASRLLNLFVNFRGGWCCIKYVIPLIVSEKNYKGGNTCTFKTLFPKIGLLLLDIYCYEPQGQASARKIWWEDFARSHSRIGQLCNWHHFVHGNNIVLLQSSVINLSWFYSPMKSVGSLWLDGYYSTNTFDEQGILLQSSSTTIMSCN